jgi:hypothetical protein
MVTVQVIKFNFMLNFKLLEVFTSLPVALRVRVRPPGWRPSGIFTGKFTNLASDTTVTQAHENEDSRARRDALH